MTTTIETIRHVYDDEAGHYIKVAPDGDGLGCITIKTDGAQADYWGKIDVTVNPAMARALAKALMDAADDADAQEAA